MTICVRYAYGPSDIVHVQGVEASYRSRHGYTLPYFSFIFLPAERNITDAHFASRKRQSYHVRNYSSGFLAPRKMTGMHFHANERLVIVLRAFNYRSGTEDLNVSMIHVDLTRPGF
jgi:inner membrane protein involved in colicin E2 resistance